MPNKPETGRKTPPNEHEWPYVWDGLDKAQKSWIVSGPIHAAVSNWKAWLVICGIVGFIRGPQIIGAIRAYLEGGL